MSRDGCGGSRRQEREGKAEVAVGGKKGAGRCGVRAIERGVMRQEGTAERLAG